MNVAEIERNPELQRVLLACYEYWKTEPLPPEQRVICFKWVSGKYREMFNREFHPAKLSQLAKLGFLKKDDTSRGGHRRYYKIVDPALVEALARKWAVAL
ncbi:MAG TPA: hypothetical protein VNK04_02715 [Gemmataceae bacterium]|nr:hypothetical protein [Gemmataceae bacterium]